jgi:plasmid stabilization system protein ParE
MSKPLILVDAASEELRRAIRHYEDERPGLGAELADLVEKVFRGLASGILRPVTVPGIPLELGVRRILLDRFPFAVVHADEPDAIYVVAVAHLRRRPGYWLSRLPARKHP